MLALTSTFTFVLDLFSACLTMVMSTSVSSLGDTVLVFKSCFAFLSCFIGEEIILFSRDIRNGGTLFSVPLSFLFLIEIRGDAYLCIGD